MKIFLGCVLLLASVGANAQISTPAEAATSISNYTAGSYRTLISSATPAIAPSLAAETSSSLAEASSVSTDVPSALSGDSTGLPDAPSPQTAQNQTAAQVASADPGQPQQTKRILGVIPNFRAVSSDAHLPPQSPREKITTSLQDGFDYSTLFLVGVQAGIAFSNKSTPEFRQGAAGYARYFWHNFADNAQEDILVEGLLPTVFREDSRYYTKGRGGIIKRTGYAFSRTLITRTDAGTENFNFSEVVGAGAASGVSSLYYPTRERTWTKVGQRWLTSVLIDGGTFAAKEFWPDINNAFFHQKD